MDEPEVARKLRDFVVNRLTREERMELVRYLAMRPSWDDAVKRQGASGVVDLFQEVGRPITEDDVRFATRAWVVGWVQALTVVPGIEPESPGLKTPFLDLEAELRKLLEGEN